MSETTFQTRIQNKSDTEQNWNAKSSFVPLKGKSKLIIAALPQGRTEF